MKEKVDNEVFLDNLPRTSNRILNILWDRNKAMTAEELTEAVNVEYQTTMTRKEIQEFIKVLVNRDYVDKKRRGFRVYYYALGMEYVAEEF